MIASVIGEPNGLVVSVKDRLKCVVGLSAVLVDLDGPVVDLGHGDDLNMVAEARVLSFARYVAVHVLCYVLLKVVRVLGDVVHAVASHC